LTGQAARQWAVEVHMTDVLARVIVPYTRFLEVRARRLHIVAELAHPAPRRSLDVAAASASMSNDEGARAAMRVLTITPAAGVQPR
jgi:hypothetical protein